MTDTSVVAGQQITAAKGGELTSGPTAPASPSLGWAWMDTSFDPPVLRIYNGYSWARAFPPYWSGIGSLSTRTFVYTGSVHPYVLGGLSLPASWGVRCITWGGATASGGARLTMLINGQSFVVDDTGGIMDPWMAEVEVFPGISGARTAVCRLMGGWTGAARSAGHTSVDLNAVIGANAITSIGFGIAPTAPYQVRCNGLKVYARAQ